MAEVLQNNTNKQSSFGRTLRILRRPPDQSADNTEADPETEAGSSLEGQDDQRLARRLRFLHSRAKEKTEEKGANVLQQQAEEKLKKEIAKKLSWRALNMAMGASVILIFVTIIVWTVQFIGGNMMGSKMIPKLSLGETILWIIGLIVIIVLFDMIVLGITLMIEVFEKPGSLIGDIINIFWKDFWSGLLGG